MAKPPADRKRPLFTAQDCANGLHLSRPAVCWWIKKLAIKRAPGMSGSGAVALLLSQEQYEELRAAVDAAGRRPGARRGAGMGRTAGRPTTRRGT